MEIIFNTHQFTIQMRHSSNIILVTFSYLIRQQYHYDPLTQSQAPHESSLPYHPSSPSQSPHPHHSLLVTTKVTLDMPE